MTSGESPAEWSGGTGVPDPLEGVIIRLPSCEADVTRPRGEGRTSLSCDTRGRGGERMRGSNVIKQAGRTQETKREPSDAVPSMVSGGACGHSRWGTHRSCYCEPVWGTCP